MNYTYEEVLDYEGKIFCITRSDGASIPTDPANSDYAAYLVWAIAEGIMEAPVVPDPPVEL